MDTSDRLPIRPGRPALRPLIDAFHKPARRRVAALARISSRHADLIAAHPAAAFVLAVGARPAERCADAHEAVRAGASLNAIADILELPTWVRKLPADALSEPLGAIFDPPQASSALVPLIPRDPAGRRAWFSWINAAGAAAPGEIGNRVGLWVARRVGVRGWVGDLAENVEDVGVLAAFAYAVATPDSVAGRFAPKTKIGGGRTGADVGRIAARMDEWLQTAFDGACLRPPQPIPPLWRKTIGVEGWRFAPRVASAELVAEGETLCNCLDTYVDLVARGRCRIYAVRRGGRTVAALEVRRGPEGRAMVVQLSGHANGPVPGPLRRAANRLVGRLGRWPFGHPGPIASREIDPAAWDALWAETWDALGPAVETAIPRGDPVLGEKRLDAALDRFYQRAARAP